MRGGWGPGGRTRSPRLALVGAGVLACVLSLIAGVVVGRAAGGSAAPQRAAARGATAAAATGPARVENGVPMGYAHTSDGALLAAAEFARVLVGPLVVHPDAYRAALREMAAPAGADELRAKGEDVLTWIETQWHLISGAARGLPVHMAFSPMSGSVTSYGGDTADVEIFGALVVSDGRSAPLGFLGGGTISLAWTRVPRGGWDWRLTSQNDLPSWGSTIATFPDAGVRPPFAGGLEELGDAPPLR